MCRSCYRSADLFEICIATGWLNTEWLASEKRGIKPSLSLML
ncbi:hypothetical protein SPAB_03452 [Salmonella enterica subsp. enterica serovar Paratyphi B str. SPB7]|uniref:Uncharacterized protein n=1 Tax=Salmonella paratyphi B (strain ATCC BAA-1250 / SPB7) TaxID=1016998 RepID=A0A6C6Z5X5_SALPB|nr:hypothetical protein SPAB_03452 [Salmonella enterica subsp. enterica serovar Paratyphi B str. SPB7]